MISGSKRPPDGRKSMTHQEYTEAAAFWANKTGEAAAPHEDVLSAYTAYVQSEKACVLATGSSDSVRATPVHYIFHDGCFYIHSEGGFKFKNLESNKNVSLAIYDSKGDFGRLMSIQVMGHAELIDPDSAEYAAICTIRKLSPDALRRLPYPMYLIKVIPDEVIVLDSSFKKQGFNIRQTLRF